MQNRFAGQEKSLKLLFPSCRLKHLLKTLTTDQHLCSSIRLTCCAWSYHTPPSSHQVFRVYPNSALVSQPEGAATCSPCSPPSPALLLAHGPAGRSTQLPWSSRGKQWKDQTQLGERDRTLSSRTLFAAFNNLIVLQQLHLQANHENTEC